MSSKMECDCKKTIIQNENIYLLPDEIFIHIFRYLQFKDLLVAKNACKKFNLLIEKYYFLMNRQNPVILFINNDKKQQKTFCVSLNAVVLKNETNFSKNNIESIDELIRSLRMFNMSNVHSLIISNCESIGIYNALNIIFPQISPIQSLYINNFSYDDIKEFEIFIRKLYNIKELEVRHICTDKKFDSNYLCMKVPTSNNLEKIVFSECQNTQFLNMNFLLELLKRNIKLRYIDIHSWDKNFIEEFGRSFFKKQEFNKGEVCNHNDIKVYLSTESEIGGIFFNSQDDVFEGVREFHAWATLHNAEVTFEELCNVCHEHWIKWSMSCRTRCFDFHDGIQI
uniref:F-box domain-containing protein n=1 Tax=Strongyloides papillosus TaxID=174720 RepID=A0A0N5BHU5_STREA